jgi:hypothetical protein
MGALFPGVQQLGHHNDQSSHPASRLRISGHTPTLLLCAYMAVSGRTYPYIAIITRVKFSGWDRHDNTN